MKILEKPFPEVFNRNYEDDEESSRKCSTLLMITLLIAFIVGIISISLNYTRCTFIDLFVIVTFFSNVYVWKIFNIFIAIRLIVILIVSIIIDIIWEIIRIYHYTANYESTIKRIRLIGLIFSVINIFLKIILIILFLKVSQEK